MEGDHREDVYCTLLMSDSYLPGAAVLAHSLRDSGTTKKLAVLVSTDTVLPSTITQLEALYNYVLPVERIATTNIANLVRLDRLDLRYAFTKIALWRQTQFRKIVYIDADVVALRAPDELFDLDVPFAAAPDIGWPDCFNSGVMLLTPSMSDFWALQTLAESGSSFDGADQGLINEYYIHKPWHRLSFAYNVTPSSSYQYEPAFRQFRSGISMVHFIGKDKPWVQGRQAMNQQGPGAYKELLGQWWAVYDRHYLVPQTSAMGQISLAIKEIKQYVRGEQTESVFGWAASGAPPQYFEGSSTSYTPTAGFQAPGFSAPAAPPPPQLPSYYRPGPPETAPPQVPAPPPASLESAYTAPEHTSVQRSTSPGATSRDATSQDTTPQDHPIEEGDQSGETHDVAQPPPTTERQRRFSAPKNEWDATKFEPPSTSRAEASSFPADHYEMSQETQLFHPPKSYPEPPKDMWYTVPEIKPAIYEKPKPIFPWETSTAGKARAPPSRVFAEDYPPEPEPEPEPEAVPEPQPEVIDPQNVVNSGMPDAASATDANVPASDPWHSFTRTNAWDDDASIDRYVRMLKKSQARRGNIQVLHHTANEQAVSETRDFATGSSGSSTPTQGRRESILLTDFPTEIERPSLPVTPAPLRRTNFWGIDKDGGDQAQQLVEAEGVPEQKDWVCPNCGYSCRLPQPSVSTPKAPASFSLAARASPTQSGTAPSPTREFLQRPFSPFSPRPRVVGSRASPHLNQRVTISAPTANFFKKNPSERLEELRRSSIVAATEFPTLTTNDGQIPTRQFPENSAPVAVPEVSNLEENFSGARTQERVEGASSDLARGMDPDDTSGEVKVTSEEASDSKKAWNAGFGLFNQDEASEEMQEPLEEVTNESIGTVKDTTSADETGKGLTLESLAANIKQSWNSGFGLFDNSGSSGTTRESVSKEDEEVAPEQTVDMPGSFPEDTEAMPGSFPEDSDAFETSQEKTRTDTEQGKPRELTYEESTSKPSMGESQTGLKKDISSSSALSGETTDISQGVSQFGKGQDVSDDFDMEGVQSELSVDLSQIGGTTLKEETGDVSKEVSQFGTEKVVLDDSTLGGTKSDLLEETSRTGTEQNVGTALEENSGPQISTEQKALDHSNLEEKKSDLSEELSQTATTQTSGTTLEEESGNISRGVSQIGTEQTASDSSIIEGTSNNFSKELSQTETTETDAKSLEGETVGPSEGLLQMHSTLEGETSDFSREATETGAASFQEETSNQSKETGATTLEGETGDIPSEVSQLDTTTLGQETSNLRKEVPQTGDATVEEETGDLPHEVSQPSTATLEQETSDLSQGLASEGETTAIPQTSHLIEGFSQTGGTTLQEPTSDLSRGLTSTSETTSIPQTSHLLEGFAESGSNTLQGQNSELSEEASGTGETAHEEETSDVKQEAHSTDTTQTNAPIEISKTSSDLGGMSESVTVPSKDIPIEETTGGVSGEASQAESKAISDEEIGVVPEEPSQIDTARTGGALLDEEARHVQEGISQTDIIQTGGASLGYQSQEIPQESSQIGRELITSDEPAIEEKRDDQSHGLSQIGSEVTTSGATDNEESSDKSSSGLPEIGAGTNLSRGTDFEGKSDESRGLPQTATPVVTSAATDFEGKTDASRGLPQTDTLVTTTSDTDFEGKTDVSRGLTQNAPSITTTGRADLHDTTDVSLRGPYYPDADVNTSRSNDLEEKPDEPHGSSQIGSVVTTSRGVDFDEKPNEPKGLSQIGSDSITSRGVDIDEKTDQLRGLSQHGTETSGSNLEEGTEAFLGGKSQIGSGQSTSDGEKIERNTLDSSRRLSQTTTEQPSPNDPLVAIAEAQSSSGLSRPPAFEEPTNESETVESVASDSSVKDTTSSTLLAQELSSTSSFADTTSAGRTTQTSYPASGVEGVVSEDQISHEAVPSSTPGVTTTETLAPQQQSSTSTITGTRDDERATQELLSTSSEKGIFSEDQVSHEVVPSSTSEVTTTETLAPQQESSSSAITGTEDDNRTTQALLSPSSEKGILSESQVSREAYPASYQKEPQTGTSGASESQLSSALIDKSSEDQSSRKPYPTSSLESTTVATEGPEETIPASGLDTSEIQGIAKSSSSSTNVGSTSGGQTFYNIFPGSISTESQKTSVGSASGGQTFYNIFPGSIPAESQSFKALYPTSSVKTTTTETPGTPESLSRSTLTDTKHSSETYRESSPSFAASSWRATTIEASGTRESSSSSTRTGRQSYREFYLPPVVYSSEATETKSEAIHEPSSSGAQTYRGSRPPSMISSSKAKASEQPVAQPTIPSDVQSYREFYFPSTDVSSKDVKFEEVGTEGPISSTNRSYGEYHPLSTISHLKDVTTENRGTQESFSGGIQAYQSYRENYQTYPTSTLASSKVTTTEDSSSQRSVSSGGQRYWETYKPTTSESTTSETQGTPATYLTTQGGPGAYLARGKSYQGQYRPTSFAGSTSESQYTQGPSLTRGESYRGSSYKPSTLQSTATSGSQRSSSAAYPSYLQSTTTTSGSGSQRSSSATYPSHLQSSTSTTTNPTHTHSWTRSSDSPISPHSQTQSQSQPWTQTSSSSLRETSTSTSTSTSNTATTTAAPSTGDFFHRITARQWAFDIDPSSARTGEIVSEGKPKLVLEDMQRLSRSGGASVERQMEEERETLEEYDIA